MWVLVVVTTALVACGRAPAPDTGQTPPSFDAPAPAEESGPVLNPFSFGSDDEVPAVRRSSETGLPNPCSIIHDYRVAAGLDTFWNRPMRRETFPRPDFTVKFEQCQYKDKANKDVRIAITTLNHSSQRLIDVFGSRGFEPTLINGRSGYIRFLAVPNPPCGALLDYDFGSLLILVVFQKDDPCRRATEVAQALEPAFAPK